MSINIVPFKSEYAVDFKTLNEAWLKKYFLLEPKDSQILTNCEANIINIGGYIYFAQLNGQIVGCYALLPYIHPRQYELSKMAVDPVYQGLKIGQHLLQHLIQVGQHNQWEKIVLYSSTHLENAIYIYIKYGFKEIPLEEDPPYSRSDIKMELILT
ncbi:Amino-acid acetyltransferase [Arenibacter antarcticus]|uniref:GNAT family N-acetyltransferase n=1 Tax=Arenibacter antarcticus TaxID=2040469 RepID=A0ABW5VDB6_9FLAO|nr:GNAT family N-acetyltransferase [Arenibacter sp. H213]MCM4168260.1 GNAT family N-acetyltransferase [Arenibacter sp. H213]